MCAGSLMVHVSVQQDGDAEAADNMVLTQTSFQMSKAFDVE